jgi:hypothetical protein
MRRCHAGGHAGRVAGARVALNGRFDGPTFFFIFLLDRGGGLAYISMARVIAGRHCELPFGRQMKLFPVGQWIGRPLSVGYDEKLGLCKQLALVFRFGRCGRFRAGP